jgi:hypothetical protein
VEEVSDHVHELQSDLTYISALFQHRGILPGEELELIKSNVGDMVESLDEAEGDSVDPQTIPLPSLSHLNHTGRRGRPRIEIDPSILSTTLPIKRKTTLASAIGCSARTVRRRQKDVEQQTGVALTPDRSKLSDADLDAVVGKILREFPHYGRSMLTGAMTVQGHNVPEKRIRASIARVRGAPARFFASRPIHRRKYYVPAANSLWHHDGQHGTLYPISLAVQRS